MVTSVVMDTESVRSGRSDRSGGGRYVASPHRCPPSRPLPAPPTEDRESDPPADGSSTVGVLPPPRPGHAGSHHRHRHRAPHATITETDPEDGNDQPTLSTNM